MHRRPIFEWYEIVTVVVVITIFYAGATGNPPFVREAFKFVGDLITAFLWGGV